MSLSKDMNNEKYKAVIIGAGNVAALYDRPNSKKISTHAHAYVENKKIELLGFYDASIERAHNAACIWGGRAFSSLGEALKEADVVSVCVPDSAHYDVLLEIAKYNILLVVAEKPLTVTLEQAYNIKEVYAERGIPIVVNYSRSFVPVFISLRDNIHQGIYGKLIKSTSYYGKGLLHNGGHLINLLTFLFGSDIEVLSVTNRDVDFFEDDPNYDVQLKINEGIHSIISIDCRKVSIFEQDLLFENARVRILDNGNIIELYTVEESTEYEGYRNYILDKKIETNWAPVVKELIEQCIELLENGKKPTCTIDDGIDVIKILEQNVLNN